jgi:hypothetical protein
MSAPTGTPDHGALARALLRRAVAVFAVVPPAERGPALAALDDFLAAPGPATYLAATRVLVEARRARTLTQVRAAQADYARARGLDAVRRELGTATAEALAAAPSDERAGLRLRALTLLAAAHRELAERVAGSSALLRQQLALSRDKRLPPRRRVAASR